MLDLNLSRRAIAAGWRWAPGSLVWGGDRVTEDTLGIAHGVVPDFDDDGTRGVLLGQVRERWDCPDLHTRPQYDHRGNVTHWQVLVPRKELHPHGWKCFEGPTETAALVTAMEAAPKEKG